MSQYDEILDQVPISQLAGQLGVDEGEARQAAEQALPALLGGLHANAADPAGANSIMYALTQHQGDDIPNDLEQVDVADGQKIVGNIFGDNTDQVMNQLGGLGGGTTGSLVKKMLPVLAPIVLSWLAKRMSQQGGLGGMLGGDAASGPGSGQLDSGPLFPGGPGAQSAPTQQPAGAGVPAQQDASNPIQDVLGGILGGSGGGDLLDGLLGGLLGGGRR
ncbi:MAG TPA: DUF937 domain-containing protein [Intrasporangium sp.]|nr:DUF937 domain-containing protein [Intrasporangium sp.]